MTTIAPDSTATPAAALSAASDRVLAILSLVLGIGAIVMGFHVLVAVAGLVLGILSLRREATGRGLAVAGIVTSSVSLAGVAIGGAALLAFLPLLGIGAIGGLF